MQIKQFNKYSTFNINLRIKLNLRKQYGKINNIVKKIKMKCFLCKNDQITFPQLLRHFKLYHGLSTLSTYKCGEENCAQYFQNKSSFKRHVLKKHSVICKTGNNIGVKSIQVRNANRDIPLMQTHLCSTSEENIPQEFKPEIIAITESSEFDLNSNINFIQESAVKLSLGLHNNNNFTKTDIKIIQENVTIKLVQPIIKAIRSLALAEYTQSESSSKMLCLLKSLEDPFSLCKTDYRLTGWLIKNDYLHSITQITIHDEISEVFLNGEVTHEENKIKGVILPLRFQFKKVFEKEYFLKSHLDYMDELYKAHVNSSTISNFIQGKLWKKKISLYKHESVIPYFLYIDDLEINNPLGSHAGVHSVANIYYSFPCSNNTSKLENIFLAAIIKSSDLKDFGNDTCLLSLVEELKYLEDNGLNIRTSEGEKNVRFVLGLVLGDNLGLNCLLDMSKSFSANYYCRFCKDPKSILQICCEENTSSLRNEENYFRDLKLCDVTQSGIHKDCIFNTIRSFHVTTNFSVDLMHDIFEGICHYGLCASIMYFINTKYFTIDQLNYRKQNFNYGSIEIDNLSPPIKLDHLKNKHLKMSAREMMTFTHYFPLIIGDVIPQNDEVWLYILNLIEIIDILLCYEMPVSYINILREKIKVHNSDYIRLFNDNLKPKHHFLIHYPTILLNSGPPRNYWCFRYEAKHKEFKIYAHAITSRKHITLTLAKKFQLKFANYLLTPTPKKYFAEDKHKISTKFKDFLSTKLNVSGNDYCCYSQINFCGTKYKAGFYLTYFVDEVRVVEIIEIIILASSDNIKIICQDIDVIGFESHYLSFLIMPCKKKRFSSYRYRKL